MGKSNKQFVTNWLVDKITDNYGFQRRILQFVAKVTSLVLS